MTARCEHCQSDLESRVRSRYGVALTLLGVLLLVVSTFTCVVEIVHGYRSLEAVSDSAFNPLQPIGFARFLVLLPQSVLALLGLAVSLVLLHRRTTVACTRCGYSVEADRKTRRIIDRDRAESSASAR